MSRGRIVGLALVGLVILLIGGAVAAYGFYALRWACPDEDQLRTRAEVEQAFAEKDLELEPTKLPVRRPADALAYRHETENAMVYVVVCPSLCSVRDMSRAPFEASDGEKQMMRYGVGLVNVYIWTTDADRSSEKVLREKIHRIVDEELAPPPPDRCYIG